MKEDFQNVFNLENRALGLSVVMGFVTLIFVVVLAYAASDSGTTDDVTWSYWVGSLDYCGATEETDSRHSYYVQNDRDESIKLEWSSHIKWWVLVISMMRQSIIQGLL